MIRNLFLLPVLLAFFTVTDLFADSPTIDELPTFRSTCYVNQSNQIRLAIDKSTTHVVSIVLRHTNENSIVSTLRVPKKRSSSILVFDVDQLPDGLYTLELSNGQQVTTHQVTISTTKPSTPNRQVALGH